VLPGSAALGDDDDVAQAPLGGDHLGQDDVGPAHAEAEAHGVDDPGQRHRQQHPPQRLPACGAQGVGGLQEDVVDVAHRADEQRQQVDEERQRQEHDLLQLVHAEQAHGQGHEGRDGQVAEEDHHRAERRAHLREGAHEDPEGERHEPGHTEALQHADGARERAPAQFRLEPERRERPDHFARRREDRGGDEALLGRSGGGQVPAEENEHDGDRPQDDFQGGPDGLPDAEEALGPPQPETGQECFHTADLTSPADKPISRLAGSAPGSSDRWHRPARPTPCPG